jgi:hypothetical protein
MVELHSQLISLALIFCYIMIPSFTYLGTSYRPLASPLYQLSILLLLDYGWYSGLGLRCGRSRCVLACVLGAYLLDVFRRGRAAQLRVNAPWEDAIWPLTRAACRTGWRWGVVSLDP